MCGDFSFILAVMGRRVVIGVESVHLPAGMKGSLLLPSSVHRLLQSESLGFSIADPADRERADLHLRAICELRKLLLMV